MKIKIKVIDGESKGLSFAIKDGARIGRSPKVEITIKENTASRQHSIFKLKDESVFITDLGSSNGTIVNSKKIAEETKLKNNDKIRIGKTVLQLNVEEIETEKKPALKTKQKPAKKEPLIDITRAETAEFSEIDLSAGIAKYTEEQKTVTAETETKEDEKETINYAKEQAIEVVTKEKEIKRSFKPRLIDKLGVLSLRYNDTTGWVKFGLTVGFILFVILMLFLGYALFGGFGSDTTTIEDESDRPYKFIRYEETYTPDEE